LDSRLFEWMPTARVAVEFSTRLRPGEEAVVVTDTMVREYPFCRDLVDAVFAAACEVGAEVSFVEFTSRSIPNEELPDIVGSAMAAAKVVYILPTRGAIHTQATHLAKKAGARVLVLGSASSFGRGDVLSRLAPRSSEEVSEWARLTTKLADRFKKGGELHVTTKKGTDLRCLVGDLEVHTMDALYRPPGEFTHFIPGLSGGGVTPGSTEGVLVADASITPIARPLTNEAPVVMHVKGGRVSGVEGGPAASEWKAIADALGDPTAFNAAEYGFGCHPRARVPFGGPTNDERIYGGFHLGVGSNVTFGGSVQSKWHIDACATAATATLNDQVLIEDGVYQI
jgi:leucyl aminopeptidase (aminopeptidase T)